MTLRSSSEKLGKDLVPSLDSLKADVGPKKGGDKFVELVENKWGPVAGLGAAALMDYFGFGKPDAEKEKESSENTNENKSKSALAKLKSSVSKREVKKVENKKPEKSEIDAKLELKSKKMTDAEIRLLTEKIESLNPAQRVMFAIMLAREKFHTGAKHCGDWVDRIMKSVGCSATNTIYHNLNYPGLDCGSVRAQPSDIAQITPGDHLYYNNKNTASQHGNHSAIFLKWINEEEQIAQVVSYTAKSNRISVHKANFKKQGITHIAKPVIKNPVRLAELEYQLKDQPAHIAGKAEIDLVA
ncbi:hypothetical protein JW758_00330 [Candidatus Peregrinibacteria bacterium]|nr:hypothetical protein [Candidatus Peregrinibacteria bacterium]